MKKTRIFVAFLMIVALMAFTGCSNDDNTDMVPDNGTTDQNMIDDGVNNFENDVNDMTDNGTYNTTDGAMNNNNNNNNTTMDDTVQ